MAVVMQTGSLSKESVEDAAVVPVVPFAPQELEAMLALVRERLFHAQTSKQIFADTLLLSTITREIAIQEDTVLLVHAQRRLAVFELGLQVMLACPGFEWEQDADKLETLYSERATWDDRVWELLRKSNEDPHRPIGFFKQKV